MLAHDAHDIDVVVLGDSGAEGQRDPDPAGGWIGWPRRLARQLEIPDHKMHSVARRGATAASVAGEQVPAVVHLRPRLALLGCGVNDVVAGFDREALRADLARVLAWAESAEAALIAIGVPTPPALDRLRGVPAAHARMMARIDAFNAELAAGLAGAARARFVGGEALVAASDPALWSPDGIHLNATGHALAADALVTTARTLVAHPPAVAGRR